MNGPISDSTAPNVVSSLQRKSWPTKQCEMSAAFLVVVVAATPVWAQDDQRAVTGTEEQGSTTAAGPLTDPERATTLEKLVEELTDQVADLQVQVETLQQRETTGDTPQDEELSLVEGWEEVAKSVALHGFGSWSAGYTNVNRYGHVAKPKGNWHHVDLALVANRDAERGSAHYGTDPR